MSEADLQTIINQMPNKSCQLDILNTSNTQKSNRCVYSSNHQGHQSIVGQGGFCANWKTAVMKPLIKSKQKGTIKSNYQPVSNLSFTSKVVEKCRLEQFNKHCADYDLLPLYQFSYRNTLAVRLAF